MSGDGFHVSTEELKTHSQTVDMIAGDVEEAASAAGTERAGGMVYGVLFDVIAQPPLNMWADHLQDVITQNAELGHSIAAGIAANADTYEGIEDATKKHVSGAGGGSW